MVNTGSKNIPLVWLCPVSRVHKEQDNETNVHELDSRKPPNVRHDIFGRFGNIFSWLAELLPQLPAANIKSHHDQKDPQDGVHCRQTRAHYAHDTQEREEEEDAATVDKPCDALLVLR
jgi:hypothetical protein